MEVGSFPDRIRDFTETVRGEHLKSLMETGVHVLASNALGQKALDLARGDERILDDRLAVTVAGMQFENPLIVGAGWDKKGSAVDGLYRLGFAGTEVGSVLVHPQYGNKRPRLDTDKTHRVGWNAFGFNSIGQEAVAHNLSRQARPGIVGVSLGLNKLTPHEHAAWAHATVAARLHEFADYFVINVASPNTPHLRDLFKNLGPIIDATRQAINAKGPKPLFVKTTVDLRISDLSSVLETCVNHGVSGIIDTNTTTDPVLKQRYGWGDRDTGGLSGDIPEFRARANERMQFITRELGKTGLARIGVGAISSADQALERMEFGAQAVQVVTSIRSLKAKTAHRIAQGMIDRIERDGVSSVAEFTGVAT